MERMSLDFDGNVAILKFNHPEVLNAVGAQMLLDFADALIEIQDPKHGVRCLLLTGEGRSFSAGANLQDSGGGERRGDSGSGLRSSYHPILLTLKNLDMTLVTAVNGAAAGVGMSFAMMGDLVCASRQSFFLQAFARIGLVPDGGSTFMLPRLVGWGRAVELSMLAERLPAEKAHEWGIVNRLYEDNDALMDGALSLARHLANGPKSLSMIRQVYWQSWHNSFEQQLELEALTQARAGASHDFKEGVAAFLEKRDAQFKGR
ncbi:MAG: enoyl-CoA hydratase/isomerase [Pseudomonadales bacterium]|jgi:2-(1,2-epoxy-1,2-dihydrophenyl)acetyl-CoA isomerase|nr:enoyl-CoA hydratase/isomerase [Pseudomonadales bacterium]MDP6471903.1 enoyl-CoA hydratase/isomerase [Pseudomonadales bacterium]MDP6826827.1 enoyl-CoA hydratase/isomerase [Pseudomonadales bacterium]MDP6970895.1 enoyl-CoA hydratase/isomerase [Pseudomonadales bacterium]|tara:strand:+ start:924 stop:1706 length:783 start_codon:yes stop_codon:yes gene_type:complete